MSDAELTTAETLSAPLPAASSAAPSEATASAAATQVESPATTSALSTETKMLDALRTVIDPELMINIVDLGLVYAIDLEGRKASVEMTLTSPACPAGPQIIQQAKMSLSRLADVDEVEIRLVMSPPWTPDRMTDEARDQLGIF